MHVEVLKRLALQIGESTIIHARFALALALRRALQREMMLGAMRASLRKMIALPFRIC